MKRIGLGLVLVLLFSSKLLAAQETVRVAFFPNITHAQAIIGLANGSFADALGPGVNIVPHIFNAGPSVIEALFAGEIDIAYIGPNPAVNGYVKSGGKALRVLCGSTSGGAGLVVRKDSGISKDGDFHGKRIASPQLGNTQDLALRRWLKHKGYTLTDAGGDVQVIPISNPDQLLLFEKKQIDGAWTVEPWVSRLIREGGGTLYLDEQSIWDNGKYLTAVVIVRSDFLASHRDLVKKWVACHVALTRWIGEHGIQAKRIINAELKRMTGKELPAVILDDAFGRLTPTWDPMTRQVAEAARWAFEQGFLGKVFPDLSGLYDLSVLEETVHEDSADGK
jgi:NitT/TauT family transport system substrate-binding protein